jgi:ubiquinone/menaquinone biosynthesis C-methylase UbiE
MDARAQRKEDPHTFFLERKQNREESLRAQREDQMLTRAMGGPLAEQVDANDFAHVLHIACGSGDWAIEAARRYPRMSLVGIDTNPHILDYARVNAAAAQMAGRVSFQAMDALRSLAFPAASFDLVNIRLGVTFIRVWEWPALIAEMVRVTRPGGVIRITEPQIKHQNKGPIRITGIEKLHTVLTSALYHSGHLFQEDTTGITAHLAPLLARFGCQELQTKEYALEVWAHTPEWQNYYDNARHVLQGSRVFLTKWGCFQGDFDALSQQVVEEMLRPDFHISWNFLTVWGKTPHEEAHARIV